MVLKVAPIAFIFFISFRSHAQLTPSDSLKVQILRLEGEVEGIKLNLANAQQKFQHGILVATLGYATTITGGLMLGRNNDDMGQALLVVGGTTGMIGTYQMVNAFRSLTGNRKTKARKRKK